MQPLGLTVLVGGDISPRKLSLHPLELFTGRRLVATIFGGVKGKSKLPGFVARYMSKVHTISILALFVII